MVKFKPVVLNKGFVLNTGKKTDSFDALKVPGKNLKLEIPSYGPKTKVVTLPSAYAFMLQKEKLVNGIAYEDSKYLDHLEQYKEYLPGLYNLSPLRTNFWALKLDKLPPKGDYYCYETHTRVPLEIIKTFNIDEFPVIIIIEPKAFDTSKENFYTVSNASFAVVKNAEVSNGPGGNGTAGRLDPVTGIGLKLSEDDKIPANYENLSQNDELRWNVIKPGFYPLGLSNQSNPRNLGNSEFDTLQHVFSINPLEKMPIFVETISLSK